MKTLVLVGILCAAVACSKKGRGAESDPAEEWQSELSKRMAPLWKDHAYDEILELVSAELRAAEAEFGPYDPRVAWALGVLSLTEVKRSNYEEAIAFRERSLLAYERGSPRDEWEIQRAVDELFNYHVVLRQFDQALPYADRHLAFSEKADGADSEGFARSLGYVASILDMAGGYEPSAAYRARALELWERLHDRDHDEVRDSAWKLASTLDELGQTEEAEAIRERYGVGKEPPSRSPL